MELPQENGPLTMLSSFFAQIVTLWYFIIIFFRKQMIFANNVSKKTLKSWDFIWFFFISILDFITPIIIILPFEVIIIRKLMACQQYEK